VLFAGVMHVTAGHASSGALIQQTARACKTAGKFSQSPSFFTAFLLGVRGLRGLLLATLLWLLVLLVVLLTVVAFTHDTFSFYGND
jgi:hypothetical protein